MAAGTGSPSFMRGRKAAMAGVGSSGSLVAAVVCVFLVLSAVIVFKGWPGDPGERVDTQSIGGTAPAGGDAAAASSATAGATTGGAGAPASAPAARGVLGVGESSAGAATGTAATGGPAGSALGRGRSQPGPGPGSSRGRSPVAGAPSVAETVTGVVDRAAREFGPVTVDLPGTGGGDANGSPGAGPQVSDGPAPVEADDVGDAVDDAGDRAGDVVDDVGDAVGVDQGRGKDKD